MQPNHMTSIWLLVLIELTVKNILLLNILVISEEETIIFNRTAGAEGGVKIPIENFRIGYVE